MHRLGTALFLLLTLTLSAEDPLTCAGIWSPTTSEDALVRQFGRANVQRGMVYLAEGQEVRGTVVFPKDEARRIEIVWKDTRRHRRPEWIRIPTGSRWTTFAGVRLGTTLADVEKRNGRAFQLSGFDWDYGGLVTDWRGGALAKFSVPCRLQVQFDRNVPETLTQAQERAMEATSGDRDLLSSSADLRRFDVRVSEVIVHYD